MSFLSLEEFKHKMHYLLLELEAYKVFFQSWYSDSMILLSKLISLSFEKPLSLCLFWTLLRSSLLPRRQWRKVKNKVPLILILLLSMHSPLRWDSCWRINPGSQIYALTYLSFHFKWRHKCLIWWPYHFVLFSKCKHVGMEWICFALMQQSVFLFCSQSGSFKFWLGM